MRTSAASLSLLHGKQPLSIAEDRVVSNRRSKRVSAPANLSAIQSTTDVAALEARDLAAAVAASTAESARIAEQKCRDVADAIAASVAENQTYGGRS